MIYTFYSFKGGVGRSMALANLAECFREKGLRTLMIDWDLEAPGLESYFFPANSKEIVAVQSHAGLIDLLQLYRERFASVTMPAGTAAIDETPVTAPPPEEPRSRLPTFLRAAPPVDPVSPASFSERLDSLLPGIETYLCDMQPAPGGRLCLLPAGNRFNPSFGKYVAAVQNFDWTAFYALYKGKEFFEWLRSRLEAHFDVILIDSRTGVTEMGGVCTRQLADVVVSFCAPNTQNVDGTVRISESLQPQNVDGIRSQRALQLLVVPTRIDTSESDRLGDFQTRFRESFQIPDRIPVVLRKQHDPFWALQIPYIARFNYREERVIGPGAPEVKSPTDRLVDAYRRVAAALAAVAAPAHIVREKFATEIPRYFPALGPQLLLSYKGAGAASIACILRAELNQAHIPVWSDLDHLDPSLDWKAAIDRTLALVVLLSADSPDSDTLRREVRYAAQHGKPVYLVTDGAMSVSSLPVWAIGLSVDNLSHPAAVIERLGGVQKTERIPYMAPALPPETIRRDAFETVRRRLVLGDNPSLLLNGPVGCGARTLAAQICDDATVASKFSAGILWLEMGESPNIAEKWRELFVALYGDASIPADPETIRRQVAVRLGSGRFLLVLNDVRGNKEAPELPFTGKQLKTLIVTKERGWRPPGEIFTLGALSPREAVDMLGLFAPIEEPLALEISAAAGNMPLTLAAAGAAVRYLPPGEPPAVWALVLETLRREGVTGFDPMSPRIAVGLSLQAQLGRLDRVNRVRVVELAEVQEPVFSVSEVMRRMRLEQSAAIELLQELHNLFIVTFKADDAAPEKGEVRPDPLVWRYLRRPAASPQPGSVRATMSATDARHNPDVKRARSILDGREAVSANQCAALANKLKNQRYFELARQLLGKAWELLDPDADPNLALRIAQQQALCTYKDTQQPVHQRLSQALEILNTRAGLKDSTSPETLGIAGGIHKELWKHDGQRATLERSLSFYARGAANGVRADGGYTSLNAAFVQDLLASQEDRDRNGYFDGTVALRREEARRYRQNIVNDLPRMMEERPDELRQQWWVLVTMGEAFFGLRRYDDALSWLKLALQHRGADWEYEATARQLATLANLVEDSNSPEEEKTAARETLRFFLGNDAAVAASLRLGKVGLALSGGGFRASLFHIGVLARLAELDLLRHVEVLSCVSGGSIVGAHYYLEVRKLLESKPDWQILRQDYIDIVERIARDFTAGVQKNLRTRLALNPLVSLKTALIPYYTRTDRLGELYEQHIFRRALPAGSAASELWLNELTVHPPGEPDDFSPKLDNWRRSA